MKSERLGPQQNPEYCLGWIVSLFRFVSTTHCLFMKARSWIAWLVLFCALPLYAADPPLRLFLRAGVKTHGPAENGLHDHPRFLADFTQLLADRGAKVEGAMTFPSGEQLEKTDVLVMFAAEAGSIEGQERSNLEKFLKRGGGIVCLHDAVCGTNAPWFKTIIGGAWEHGHSKWFEGPLSFYYVNQDHPITAGCSNFDMDDELYWDLHMMPDVKILAGTWIPDKRNTKGNRAYPHIYEVAPQTWTYEKTLPGGEPYRAFVSIPGHKYQTFQLPHHRAVILRGIAWAGKRDVDSLCKPEELASLRYPEGGPTAPGKAAAKLELHPEFKMSLVAAEPLINKVINMDWDPQGRLWVAESVEYPNGRRGIKPAQQGNEWKDHGGLVPEAGVQSRPARDRISMLTDSDGDGIMDKKDVFFEGLELVTGFVFYRDGVIASAAPDILWIRDRNGDGKADEVVKLYTGLGTSDTHAVINNLRWGMDGWIYATHGYSAGEVKSSTSSKEFGRIGSGVVRFRPDGSAFEQYSSKGGNTWGLDFSWDGDLFYTQPTSGDLLMTVLLPESTLARSPASKVTSYQVVIKSPKSYPLMKSEDMAYVQIDWVGSFTAAAGAAIYSGGSWPASYNGSYFTTEPTINIVHHEAISPKGAGYEGHKLRTEEFIGSHDLWFRPIETRIGPDGALYVVDFYNQAVIHNDTRGPLHNGVNAAVRPDRDHYFGRIWRIDHRDAKALPPLKLSPTSPEDLMAALSHPNRVVRMNAHRLLAERGNAEISKWVGNDKISPTARVHALWIAQQLYGVETPVLVAALGNNDLGVRKTAARIAALSPVGDSPKTELQQALIKAAQGADGALRLQALVALSVQKPSDEVATQLIALYPGLNDPWLETAALAVAASSPVATMKAALAAKEPEPLRKLASALGSHVGSQGKAALASELVTALGEKAGSRVLKQSALESLSRSLKADVIPAWSETLKGSLQSLLSSEDIGLQLSVLPLVARWDKQSTLTSEVKSVIVTLQAKLKDGSQSEDLRVQSAGSLLGVRQLSADILPSISGLLGASEPASLQERMIKALGETGDAAVGPALSSAYTKLTPELQITAFNQLLKRADWTASLVDALKDGKIPLGAIGPAGLHRLRFYPDASVAKRAGTVIDDLRGPEGKEKQALITKLTPEVIKPGDIAKGHELFTANCATCHQLNDEGKEVGPALTGMGAHGPAELLVHILDPNREVDPSFAAWNFETKDGENYDGVIARENRSAVTLRNAAGEMELKRDAIKSQRNTGRSLMPEGFEALGAEGLRNVLAFITGGDSRFRVVDMRRAFNADSTHGIYVNAESTDETLRFKKFGITQVDGVPFEVLSPTKSPSGKNVLVLRGGFGFAKTLPLKTEIEVTGIQANRLHFLGGVAGWGYPCCGENKDLPVAKMTVLFADGQKEEFTLKNGVEFADYNGMAEVTGSKLVPDLVPRGQQVRWFTKYLKHSGELAKITLESPDNQVAATFVAITAELGDPKSMPAVSAAAAPTEFEWGTGIRTLLVGGGSSHDFNRWFNLADVATLSGNKELSVHYTERYSDVIPALRKIDVLAWSANSPQSDPQLRASLLSYADSGKGLVLIHPGNWYIWNDWPEWNRILVGGGTKSHDKYGEFEVTVSEPSHPLMKGLPAMFKISDELYHFEIDPKATPIQVLAIGRNLATSKTYPLIWITKHPKARIVNITLGHDGMSHDHPAYKQLLKNSIQWAANRPMAASLTPVNAGGSQVKLERNSNP